MGKPRACDVCSLRKIRCNGMHPCLPCVKANFDCSYAKQPQKPGPKGPRTTTSNRIKKKLHDIRTQASTGPQNGSRHTPTSATTASSSQLVQDGIEWPSRELPRQIPVAGPSSVTQEDVYAYLRIYHHRMYAVWPVVDVDNLIARLGPDMMDTEACALAFSVCAAAGAQLRLDDFDSPASRTSYSIIDYFAQEAERRRSALGSQENASVAFILIPFFLSMYYSSRKRRFTSTLLLRESLTFCELLDLDKEASFASLDIEEQRYRRKVFWLLFITERGTAMQYDLATVLGNTIALPGPEDDKDPVTFTGFVSLVHLFVAVEGTLVGLGARDSATGLSTEVFATLQQKLRDESQMPTLSNEVQRTDITVTQQWMRMLVWQLAMKKVSMIAGASDDPLSLTYPAHVAKDALSFLSKVSLGSIIAHGPGMEMKIFEIANTLLDVINCVPSLTMGGSALMKQGPRDIFHGLSCLLASLSGSQSRSVALLQGKMAESNVPFMPIPRFVEVKDEGLSSSFAHEISPSGSPNSFERSPPVQDWQPLSHYGTQLGQGTDASQNGWLQRDQEPLNHPASSLNDHVPFLGLATGIAGDWPSSSSLV